MENELAFTTEIDNIIEWKKIFENNVKWIENNKQSDINGNMLLDRFFSNCFDVVLVQEDFSYFIEILTEWIFSRKIPEKGGQIERFERRILVNNIKKVRYILEKYIRIDLLKVLSVTKRQQEALINLWINIFLNPTSPIHMQSLSILVTTSGIPDNEKIMHENDENWCRYLLIQSMYYPNTTYELDKIIHRLFNSNQADWCKIILCFWLIKMPEVYVKYSDNVLNNLKCFCEFMKNDKCVLNIVLLEKFAQIAFSSMKIQENQMKLDKTTWNSVVQYIECCMYRHYPTNYKNGTDINKEKLKIGYLKTTDSLLEKDLNFDSEKFEVHIIFIGTMSERVRKYYNYSNVTVHFLNEKGIRRNIANISSLELDIMMIDDVYHHPMVSLLIPAKLALVQLVLFDIEKNFLFSDVVGCITDGINSDLCQTLNTIKRIEWLPQMWGRALFPEIPNFIEMKKQLGIPSEVVVYLCAIPGAALTNDMQEIILSILKKNINSYVLMIPFHQKDNINLRYLEDIRTNAELSNINGRLAIMPAINGRSELFNWIGISDIILSPLDGDGWEEFLTAAILGIPTITLKGVTPKTMKIAKVLELAEVKDGISISTAGYIEEAIKIGLNPELRIQIGKTLRDVVLALLFSENISMKQYEEFVCSIWKTKSRID